MTEGDHLLAALLSFMSLSLLFRKATAPDLISRSSFYISAAVTSIGLGGITLFLWHLPGRPLAEFGLLDWLGAPALTLAIGLGWTLGLVILVVLIGRGFWREALLKIFRKYEQLYPRSNKELAASWGVSAAAGAGEEIAYRGFLLWYGSMLLGSLGGLLASSLLFGIAHGYQSRFGVVFATLAGLMLGGIYLASGSLLLVMWIHATYDMASFTAGRLLLRAGRSPAAPATVPDPVAGETEAA